MNVLMSLYLAALFVAFVPGILVTLPKGGSKYTVLAVHAALFTLVWHFTHKMVWRLSHEGFQNVNEYNGNEYNSNNSMNNSSMNNSSMNNSGNAGNAYNSEAFKMKK